MKPDYYLALPWHFLDEFLEREKEFLDRGGKFIVPLPEVREVDGSGRGTPWRRPSLRAEVAGAQGHGARAGCACGATATGCSRRGCCACRAIAPPACGSR